MFSQAAAGRALGASPRPAATSAVRFLERLFEARRPRHAGFRLWTGEQWPANGTPEALLVLNRPESLRNMFGAGTEKALAEAYLRGDFDIEGDLEAAFEIADLLRTGPRSRRIGLLWALLRLPKAPPAASARHALHSRSAQHSLERDRGAIAFHYDISNDFYRLWLDRNLVYSCGYFESRSGSLEGAQVGKFDHICRKLRLQPGQALLDIGCGWGGLAIHAARNYGARVVGVTLSKNQAALARERAAAEGLGRQVEIRCSDYRELADPERFDAVVSVGMAEHVGSQRLGEYFGRVYRLLKPGGAFLNHAIGEGCRYDPTRGPSFIDQYVFPDSDIPPVQTVLARAAESGFEVRDVENLREHYAITLRHWVRRLEAGHDAALKFVAESTYRIWRLYMAGSAYGFKQGRLAIYQTLLVKLDDGGAAHVPLTRADWYRQAGYPEALPKAAA
jgi:cyclopropane-fatty-acyl-phospholipid synthase